MIAILFLFLFEGMLCTVMGMGSAAEETCLAVSLLLMAVNTIALAAYITKRYRDYEQIVVNALLFSLLFKVALLLWDYYGTSIFILPNSHADSESYQRQALYFAQYGTEVENYSYIVGTIYRLFGVQRITAQYFNIILSFLGISMFEKSMTVLEMGEEQRKKALILAAVLPNYAIMSAILIRECLISVVLSISLYSFALWWKKGNLLSFIVAELISFGACTLHSGAIAMTIGIAISFILTRRDFSGERKLSIGFSAILFSAIFFVGFMYLFNSLSDSLLWKFHGLSENAIDNFIDEHDIYSAAEDTSSTYTAGIANLTGWRGVLINSPIRLVYFLWVPMPWDIRGIGDIIAFFGSSLFYGGTVFAAIYKLLRGRVDSIWRPFFISVLVIALSGALVFAWGTDSAGTALRHREKFYFIYLLLFAALQNDIYRKPVLDTGGIYEKSI